MERTEEGRDLIETLWNVKEIEKPELIRVISDLIETLWNVKFENTICCPFFAFDLIETLWNVKLYEHSEIAEPDRDLIETLWNVKITNSATESSSGI